MGLLNDQESVKYGVIVILGEVQVMPCEYLFCGKEEGVIIVALLFTTPWAVELGEATVVLAKVGLIGKNKNKAIAQK